MIFLEILLLVAALFVLVALGLPMAREWLSRQEWVREKLGWLLGAAEEGTTLRPPGGMRGRLLAAGLRIGPIAYWVTILLVAVILALLTLEVFPGAGLLALLVAFLVAYLPYALLRWWARVRAQRCEERLGDGIDLLVSALEGGESLPEALAYAAESADQPVRGEFREITRRLRMGMEVDQALRRMVEGYDSESVRIFCQTLAAKWEAGGDLAPVLRSVSRIIRERVRQTLELRSQLAGARLAAFLMALLPYVLVVFYYYRRPQWIDAFRQHALGMQLLLLAILLQIVGLLWLRRIYRIET